MGKPLIRLNNLYFSYDGAKQPVLSGLSFDVQAGEWVHICGPSGSGKSALAAVLTGLVPRIAGGRLEGELEVFDLNPSTAPIAEIAKVIGTVFQDPDAQLVQGVVEDEVAFGPENLCVPPEDILRRVEAALADVELLPLRSSSVHQLSGGQRQRTGIAAVLALAAPILVLDDASASLDASARRRLLSLLRRLQGEGRTIITLSSRLDAAAESAGRLLVLAGGAVKLAGAPAELLRCEGARLAELGVLPRRAQQAGRQEPLQEALPMQGQWRGGASAAPAELPPAAATLSSPAAARPIELCAERAAQSAISQHIPSAASADFAPAAPAAEPPAPVSPSAPLLALRDLTYTYPRGRAALRGVSLELAPGEWALLGGQNGSGKTTLTKLLMGLLRPPKGSVFLGGRDVSGMRIEHLAQTTGYVFQEPEHQFVTGSVLEEMLFGPKAQLKRGESLPADVPRRAVRLLAEAGLAEKQQISPYLLSGGEKRLLGAAAQFMMPKQLYILDEPTAGTDYAAAELLVQLCKGAADEGAALLVITHEPELFGNEPNCIFTMEDGLLLNAVRH